MRGRPARLKRKRVFLFELMATGKKSVLLYCDLIHTIEKMDDETAGKLFKHYLRYVNDLNPVPENLLVELTFEPIKQQLKRDLQKWDEQREKRSIAGKISAEKRSQQKQQVLTSVKSVEQASTNSTVNDTVTVNVNVTDTVNNNNILLEKEPKEKRFNFKAALLQENFDPKLVEDWIKVRKVKRAANTETSFKMFLNQIHEAERRFHKDRNELLELTVSRSWQTFKVEYIENLNSQNGTTKQQPANAISRDEGKQLAYRRAMGID